jgi:hypothetical protein
MKVKRNIAGVIVLTCSILVFNSLLVSCNNYSPANDKSTSLEKYQQVEFFDLKENTDLLLLENAFNQVLLTTSNNHFIAYTKNHRDQDPNNPLLLANIYAYNEKHELQSKKTLRSTHEDLSYVAMTSTFNNDNQYLAFYGRPNPSFHKGILLCQFNDSNDLGSAKVYQHNKYSLDNCEISSNSQGAVIVAGSYYDKTLGNNKIFFLQRDPAGNTKYIRELFITHPEIKDGSLSLSSCSLDDQGNCYFTAWTDNFPHSSLIDPYWVVGKLDEKGNLVYLNQLNRLYKERRGGINQTKKLVVLPNGHVLVLGSNRASKLVLMEFDSHGNCEQAIELDVKTSAEYDLGLLIDGDRVMVAILRKNEPHEGKVDLLVVEYPYASLTNMENPDFSYRIYPGIHNWIETSFLTPFLLNQKSTLPININGQSIYLMPLKHSLEKSPKQDSASLNQITFTNITQSIGSKSWLNDSAIKFQEFFLEEKDVLEQIKLE